jgi:hypothetical protein
VASALARLLRPDSREAGNDRGAKGPEQRHAESEERAAWMRIPSHYGETGSCGATAGNGPERSLPEKLSHLRQKLGQKNQAGAEIPVLCVV